MRRQAGPGEGADDFLNQLQHGIESNIALRSQVLKLLFLSIPSAQTEIIQCRRSRTTFNLHDDNHIHLGIRLLHHDDGLSCAECGVWDQLSVEWRRELRELQQMEHGWRLQNRQR